MVAIPMLWLWQANRLAAPGQARGDIPEINTAVLLLGILHNVGDEYDPHGIVRRLTRALADGSYLAIGHSPRIFTRR